MTNEIEKIGVDVWIAATIYVPALNEEQAKAIVKDHYAGSREKPDTYEHMNGKDLPLDGDDFMSSAITLYGLCTDSELFSTKDSVRDAGPDMLAALKAIKNARGNCGASPFEQRACDLMDAAIAKAEGRTNG